MLTDRQTDLCAQQLILCRQKLMQSWTGKSFAYIILKDIRHSMLMPRPLQQKELLLVMIP